jgi:hypothetical protein
VRTVKPGRRELRCFCSGAPLLATYGVDEQGRVYVHMKVYKQSRIYGEIIVYAESGSVKIHCRQCFRWHRVTFTKVPELSSALEETEAPPEIA